MEVTTLRFSGCRSESKQIPPTANDITPLITRHSLGGLLRQVDSDGKLVILVSPQGQLTLHGTLYDARHLLAA